MNISAEEEKAFKELLNDNTIVIRPADKGSGIVIVDMEQYTETMIKEMENSASYKETETDLTESITRKVKKLVNKMYKDGKITKDLQNYLLPDKPHAGKLKGNPKIHKTGNQFRAIVDGKGSPTEKLAEVSEKELNEFVVTTPSYIKDTTDFINKLGEIKHHLPENTILFCLDVTKLYPSIPIKEGMEACKEALEMRSKKSIPTECVMDMIKTVLEGNNFVFLDKQYIQTEGVAIGSKLGKNFACSYMRKWDTEALKYPNKSLYYKRYIDDVFGIWEHGSEELEKFVKHANSVHENIKIELRWSYNRIEFLDTLVKIEGRKVQTEVYRKPTDKHMYVHMNSNHPNNVKKAIPYGQGIRLKRICSKREDYTKNKDILKRHLRKRGYSGKFIDKELEKVDRKDRNELLKYKENKKKIDRIPLVMTFNKQLPNLHHITKKHLSQLHMSEEMKAIFPEPPLVAYRRDRNLADILVHGKLNRQMKLETGNIIHDSEVCRRLNRENEITSIDGKKNFKLPESQDCQTQNVVYMIYCGKCKKTVYIGETARTFQERLKEHLKDIEHKRDKSVANHFNGDDHSLENFECAILQKIYSKSHFYRLIKETEWIRRIGTQKPNGLNTKTDLSVLWTNFKDN